MGESYYDRKAREAHEAVERRSRDAHSSMEQRRHGKQPDARDTPRYKQGGEGDSESETESETPVASGDTLMLNMTLASAVVLGAIAVKKAFSSQR